MGLTEAIFPLSDILSLDDTEPWDPPEPFAATLGSPRCPWCVVCFPRMLLSGEQAASLHRDPSKELRPQHKVKNVHWVPLVPCLTCPQVLIVCPSPLARLVQEKAQSEGCPR